MLPSQLTDTRETLRARLRRGDPTVLVDPALPLEQLTDPGPWWAEGERRLAEGLCVELGAKLVRTAEQRRQLATVLSDWQRNEWLDALYEQRRDVGASVAVSLLRTRWSAFETRKHFLEATQAPALLPHGQRIEALLDLARRLLALGPRRAAPLQATLGLLERRGSLLSEG